MANVFVGDRVPCGTRLLRLSLPWQSLPSIRNIAVVLDGIGNQFSRSRSLRETVRSGKHCLVGTRALSRTRSIQMNKASELRYTYMY